MPRTDIGQCRHHHYRLNGYCPFCSGTLVDAALKAAQPVSDERIDEIMRDCGINPSVRFGDVWTGNVQLRKFARALLREAQQAAPKGTR